MYCLLILVVFVNTIFTAADNSTCSGSGNFVCTVLPFNLSNPPDIWLNVPDLSVDEISLVVENIQAHVSLSATVANLVSLNAGVDVSIETVNLTILGVKAQVQLAVYLDNIAKIVNRTMASLDLNPLLTSVVNGVFETVDNLLGTLTQNGQRIHQLINDAGQIVNQVLSTTGQVLSSVVVGNYLQNMTFTGLSEALGNGETLKQYSYPPPAGSSQSGIAYVNIVFDAQGNAISATIVNPSSTPATTTNSGVTNPPTTNSGATNPPTTNSGATNPPTTNSGVTNPPTTNSEATNPPTTNSGATNPSTTNSGATNPPTTNSASTTTDASPTGTTTTTTD